MAAPYKGKAKLTVDGAMLSEIRITAGLSMAELAAKLKCNKSQVSRWERNQLIPSEKRVLKMVGIFKRGDFVVERKKAK